MLTGLTIFIWSMIIEGSYFPFPTLLWYVIADASAFSVPKIWTRWRRQLTRQLCTIFLKLWTMSLALESLLQCFTIVHLGRFSFHKSLPQIRRRCPYSHTSHYRTRFANKAENREVCIFDSKHFTHYQRGWFYRIIAHLSFENLFFFCSLGTYHYEWIW